MARRTLSSNLRVESLEDRCNPSTLDPFTGALAAPPSGDPSPTFPVYRGIDGDVSTDELDLVSWDRDATRTGAHAGGGGGGAGKVSMRDFSFTMKVARPGGGAGLDVLIANTGGDRDASLDDNQHGTHVAGAVGATGNMAIDYRHPDLYRHVWIHQAEVESGFGNDVVFGG